MPQTVGAQGRYQFHLGTDNGLPSDVTYNIIKDRFGYLWVPTEKGVVRYNGYNCKIFTENDGLPADDNWQLFEDAGGRIWLGNISTELGYIYNDKYYASAIRQNRRTIYPKNVTPYRNGLLFTSQYMSGGLHPCICVAGKDSAIQINIPDSIHLSLDSTYSLQNRPLLQFYFDDTNSLRALYNNVLYNVKLNRHNVAFTKRCSIDDTGFFTQLGNSGKIIVDTKIFRYVLSDTSRCLKILDIFTGSIDLFCLPEIEPGDRIRHLIKCKSGSDNVAVITEHKIITFNARTGPQFRHVFQISDLTGGTHPLKVNGIYNDDFWGICVPTSSGLWLNYEKANRFIKNELDFSGYRYVGGKNELISFWWHQGSRTLRQITPSGTSNIPLPGVAGLKQMLYTGPDTFMAVIDATEARANFYYIVSRKKWIKCLKIPPNGCYKLLKIDATHYIHASLTGLFRSTITNDSEYINPLDFDRFVGLEFDSFYHRYIAYTRNRILIVSGSQVSQVPASVISGNGQKKIEQVVANGSNGHLFIYGSGKLVELDPVSRQCKELLPGFNLNKAKIRMYRNYLVVASKGGIIITGTGWQPETQQIQVIRNTKEFYYSEIYDFDIVADQMLLSTDRGAYSIDLAGKIAENNAAENETDYHLLLQYHDSLRILRGTDTVKVDQNFLKLGLDVINPTGIGHVYYNYELNGIYGLLRSGELLLPGNLEPGHFYTLRLEAHDDIWKSKRYTIVIYVRPYGLQLLFLNQFFWPGIITIFLIFSSLTIALTIRIVNRANLKKNLRQELEIRSVHAQINPHFIYNTLNTALYFVKLKKMDEAYQHISKFSKLLRAYIKTSRQRYINIANEIANIENYIQLQQSRFETLFDYSITVDPGIDVNVVNIPALLLQPIVENAIDHGLFHKQGPGAIFIKFSRFGKKGIECRVEDDGIGRKASRLINQERQIKSESFGNSLIVDLISIFNKYERSGITVQYVDKELPESGTTVIITIKNPKYDI